MNVPINGYRAASAIWQDHLSEVLSSLGFRRCVLEPCAYRNDDTDVDGLNHGDDLLVTGPREQLVKLKAGASAKLVCSSSDIVSPDPQDAKVLRFLKREITCDPALGWLYEADKKHADEMIQRCGLTEEAKSCVTPGVQETLEWTTEEERDVFDPKLTPDDEIAWRGIGGVGQFLAGDRLDIKYATKEALRDAGTPRESSWKKLKRIARYLLHARRMQIIYIWQKKRRGLRAGCDASHAGCPRTRKAPPGSSRSSGAT